MHQVVLEQQTQKLGEDRKVSNWLVQQPEKWFPTLRWEGEDMILEADRSVHYQPTSRKRQVLISLKIVEAFGFMKYDSVAKTWKLGPNLIPSYPTFEYSGYDVSAPLAPTLKGPTQRALMAFDVDTSDPRVDWFRLPHYYPGKENVPCVDLSSALEWHFIRLNQSYEQCMNYRWDTVMVYTE